MTVVRRISVLFSFPKSPRNVTPAQAGELASQKGNAQSVAVTVNADNDFLDEIVENMTFLICCNFTAAKVWIGSPK